MVLPILHLNGYKIANPCRPRPHRHEELRQLFRGYGYKPYFVEGHDPETMHQQMAATLDAVVGEIQRIQADARENGIQRAPALADDRLRTPKGWTCPTEIDGKKCEDYWRSHQVPMGDMDENPSTCAHPRRVDEELPARGAVRRAAAGCEPELAELAPKGSAA